MKKVRLVVIVCLSLLTLVSAVFLRSKQKNVKCMANVRSLEYLYHAYEKIYGKAPLSIEELKSAISERDDIAEDSFNCPWSGKQYILNAESGSLRRTNGVPVIWCPVPHKSFTVDGAEEVRTVAFRDYVDGGIRQVPENEFEVMVGRSREKGPN